MKAAINYRYLRGNISWFAIQCFIGSEGKGGVDSRIRDVEAKHSHAGVVFVAYQLNPQYFLLQDLNRI